MFHGDRWAGVFVAALGENAEAGLLCLKALVPPIRAIPCALSGFSTARRLERLLRESVNCADSLYGREAVAEYAIRFIALLVEKGRFKCADSVMEKIQEKIDAQNGTLSVVLESAVPLDRASAEEFSLRIAEKTGAVKVRMETRLAPELLGGYRLQAGGFFVDASLKTQAEKMRAELERTALACSYRAPAPTGETQNDGF